MVKPNVQIAERRQTRLERLTGKKSPQHAFNSLLWRIVADAGGVMSIKGSDLRKIPNKVLLKGEWDEATQSLIVTSVVNHGNIETLPTDGIIII